MKQKLSEIYVDFTGRLEKLKGSLARAKRMVSSATKTLGRWAKRLALATGVALAAALAWSTKKALVQEKALTALTAALRNTGDATDKNINRFKAFAASIQQLTIFGDEEILSMMAMIKNLGVQTGALESATKKAIGLAAATGRDIKTMAMYIALAEQGEFTMLRRYIPALRSTTDETEQLAILTKFCADGFKVAQEQAKDTSGVLKQMWNVIGDVAEKIGDTLLPPLKSLGTALRDWFKLNQSLIGQKFEDYIKGLGIEADISAESITNAFERIALATKILANMWNLLKIVGLSVGNIFRRLTAFVLGYVGALTYLHGMKLFSPKMRTWGKSMIATSKEMLNKAGEVTDEIDELGSKGWATEEKIRKSFDAIRRNMEKVRRETKKFTEAPKGDLPVGAPDSSAVREEQIKILQQQQAVYEKMGDEGKAYQEIHRKLLKLEAEEYEDMLNGKLKATEIFNKLIAKEEKDLVKSTRIERLGALASMFESMKGYEQEHAIVQKAIWKEQAEEYARTGLITAQAAYAGLAAATTTADAAAKAQAGFAGFQQAWSDLVREITARRTQEDQLNQLKQQTEQLKEIKEATQTTAEKTDEGGFGP